MQQIVYLNNNYLDLTSAMVSVMDRGFLFADGVYEVIPVYGSHAFFPEEHYSRLLQSLEKVNITPAPTYLEFMNIINELVRRNEVQPMQSVYLQLTRGVSWTRKQFATGLVPTVFAKLEPFARIPSQSNTMKAITVEDSRWGHCDIKGINRLANVLMMQAAYQAHVDEAIIVSHDFVVEGSSSNIFIVEKDTVITPPVSERLLNGITRKMVIQLVKEKYKLIEEDIHQDRLFSADEVWLTSSTKEVVGVVEIDSKIIGNGTCGPKAIETQNRYRKHIDDIVHKNLSHAITDVAKP